MVRHEATVTLSVTKLVAIAQKAEKSNISYLSQAKPNCKTDMIRGMKRRTVLRFERAVP